MHGMLRKVTFLEISRSLLFIGVAGLQYTVCNATRNELLSTFLKDVLKLIENFGEVVSKRFIIRNIQTCKLQLSTLRVFKTPEITSTVEFLSSEAGAKRVLNRTRSQDFTVDVLLHKKHRKAKIKTSKDKKLFCNPDADSEISKWPIKTCVCNKEK